jgi:hypothetical protein
LPGIVVYASWVSDHSTIGYSNWAKGEPNNDRGVDDCGQLYCNQHSFPWKDAACSELHVYICEKMIIDAAGDRVYQLLAHGWWFSLGTPASPTTKTGHHDIAEILLKMALKHQKSNQSSPLYCNQHSFPWKDAACSELHVYICEKMIIDASTTIPGNAYPYGIISNP